MDYFLAICLRHILGRVFIYYTSFLGPSLNEDKVAQNSTKISSIFFN